jgi:hypothetical protein
MGRGRLFAYEASQMGRLESDRKVRSVFNAGDEPTAQDIDRWRRLNVK